MEDVKDEVAPWKWYCAYRKMGDTVCFQYPGALDPEKMSKWIPFRRLTEVSIRPTPDGKSCVHMEKWHAMGVGKEEGKMDSSLLLVIGNPDEKMLSILSKCWGEQQIFPATESDVKRVDKEMKIIKG